MQALDRRSFVNWFAGTSVATTLFPGALWAIAQQQQNRITKEMLVQAEQLAGLSFTDRERDAMLNGKNGNLRAFEQLRTVNLPNSVAPAIQFEPLIADLKLPALKRPPRYSSATVTPPQNIEQLAFWPVLQQAALVRTGRVSPVALTEMYVDRLKRFGGKLEAVVTLTEDRALEQARTAEKEIKAGRYRGPLHGIPWGARDLLAVKGYKTTWGASPYKDQVIDEDATVVKRLDAAGAILVAKLTLGALAQGDRWYGGMTRNPWKLDQGSSGSSAGPARRLPQVWLASRSERKRRARSFRHRRATVLPVCGPRSDGWRAPAPWHCPGPWTRSDPCAGPWKIAPPCLRRFRGLTCRTSRSRTKEPERSTWPNSFRAARMIPAVEYIQANRVRTLVMQAVHQALKDVDVVVRRTSTGSTRPNSQCEVSA